MTAKSDSARLSSGPEVVEAWRSFRRDWAGADDYSALVKLGRRAGTLAAADEIGRTLTPVRVAILSSATVDFLLPILAGALYYAGVRPFLHPTPYGQTTQSLLDDSGPLIEFAPQITLVLQATPHLPGWPALTATLPEVERRVDEVCASLLGPCATFHERTGSDIVLDNFHPLPARPAGNLGARLPGDPTTFVRRVNLALGDRAPRFVHVHDVASLAESHGLETWFDERYWYLARQPVSFACVGDYGRSLAAVIGAILGRSRKCLVLDLDNTLWGGVIGDDGLGGIQLGEGSPDGEAFAAFQRYLRGLKDRGVLLAVSSKNDDGIARLPFTDHPDMVLGLDDFIVFKANWEPKSESIRAIARELDLPLSALAFVDDNPAEREEIAQALPEVAVPELPGDPAGFIRALERERLFESTTLTGEDLQRTTTYHARRDAMAGLAEATDIGAYLASLEMQAVIRPFERIAFERITQLVNKTNQFNLTTMRVVPGDIERLAADPRAFTRTVRLRDRFADHGLISVLYGHIDGTRLRLDAWLMSCRVLGRGVEQLLFNEVLAAAIDLGLREIVGRYRPTDRNMLVKDHYLKLGFHRAGDAAGVEEWMLDVAEASRFEPPIATSDVQPIA